LEVSNNCCIFVIGKEKTVMDTNELTWMDLQTIDDILQDMGKDGPELFKTLGGNMNYYKEALRRFNEQKNK